MTYGRVGCWQRIASCRIPEDFQLNRRRIPITQQDDLLNTHAAQTAVFTARQDADVSNC